jgi:hypothetical protein
VRKREERERARRGERSPINWWSVERHFISLPLRSLALLPGLPPLLNSYSICLTQSPRLTPSVNLIQNLAQTHNEADDVTAVLCHCNIVQPPLRFSGGGLMPDKPHRRTATAWVTG